MMSKKRMLWILNEYQLWRRGIAPYHNGGEVFPVEPQELGIAIDLAIQYLQEKE